MGRSMPPSSDMFSNPAWETLEIKRPAPSLAMTYLDKIFKGIKAPYGQMLPYQVHHARRSHPKLMGTVLMACVAEQTQFLTCLWAQKYPPDDDVRMAWKALATAGMVAELLDTDDTRARDLFTAAYNGVMVARGKL